MNHRLSLFAQTRVDIEGATLKRNAYNETECMHIFNDSLDD